MSTISANLRMIFLFELIRTLERDREMAKAAKKSPAKAKAAKKPAAKKKAPARRKKAA
jgi:hypothetical protein